MVYCNFSVCDLKEVLILILRELNRVLHLELVKMNKPTEIIKTIKENVFHFERPLVRFGFSHTQK